MKKFLALFGVVLCMMLVVSCVKDDLPKPPYPPVVTYTVAINAIGKGVTNPEKSLTLIAGSTGKVIATPEQGVVLYKATLSTVGEIPLPKMEGDIQINIPALSSNAELRLDFISKMLYTLVKQGKPYHLDSMNVHNSNNILVKSIVLTDAEKNDEYSFTYPDMRFVCKSPNGAQSSSPFSLSGSILKIDNNTYYVQESRTNEDKFVNRTPPESIPGYVGLVTTEYVYVRR